MVEINCLQGIEATKELSNPACRPRALPLAAAGPLLGRDAAADAFRGASWSRRAAPGSTPALPLGLGARWGLSLGGLPRRSWPERALG